MKKVVLVTIWVMAAVAGVFADDIFFPAKKGMALVTASLGADGKPESFARLTVKDVSGSGADKSITYVVTPLDNKKKPSVKGEGFEYTIKVINNVLELDMRNILAGAMPELPPGASMDIKGGKMKMPTKLSVGDKLEDANMNMSMDMGMVSMSVDVSVTNHKCVAMEKVTVPAGTFECYKVTGLVAVKSSIMGNQTMNVANNVTTWYAKGIGSVKSVVADAKGKVESSSELHEIVR